MKATHIVRSLMVLAAVGTLAAAQTPPAKPAPAAKPAQSPTAQTQPKEAAAKAEAVPLKFSVTGLTKENAAKVKEALQGLSTQVYVCDACKVSENAAGECPKCKGALKPEKVSLVSSATPSADDNSISMTLEPKAPVHLSEIESTLGKNSVKIDPAKFPISGKANLIVKGATAESAQAIEKALTDAKLFDDVKANFDATTNEVVIHVRSGANAPTRAKVAAAIEGAKATLSDVVWGHMGKA